MSMQKVSNSGPKLMQGNEACAAGALAAGCRFMAGYPITPATEIPEYLSDKMFAAGGVFMQMEDELASINAVIGASWGGARAMTATSGPGFTLMQESIGYAIFHCECYVLDTSTAAVVGDELSDCAVFACSLKKLNLCLSYLEKCSFHFLVGNFFNGEALQTKNVFIIRDSLFKACYGYTHMFDMRNIHNLKSLKIVCYVNKFNSCR